MEVLTSRLTSLLKNSLFGGETLSKTRYFLKYRLWTSRSCLVVFHHIYCNERQRTRCAIVGSLTSYNWFPSSILLWLSCKLQAIANLSKSEKSYEGRVVIVSHEFACWSSVMTSRQFGIHLVVTQSVGFFFPTFLSSIPRVGSCNEYK